MMQQDVEVPVDIEQMLSEGMCSGGVSEDIVAETEHKLGLSFPLEYRAFLKKFGSVLMQGYEIYGLVTAKDGDDNDLWTDVRTEIKFLERNKVPKNLIPISTDGTEYFFFITTTRLPHAAENSVVVQGPDRDNVQIAIGFFEFLRLARPSGVFHLVE